MAGVLPGEPLAEKDMAEVRVAGGAGDLGALPVRVLGALHGAGHLVVEARPAAMRIELVLRTVEGRLAAAADVGPRAFERDVLPVYGLSVPL